MIETVLDASGTHLIGSEVPLISHKGLPAVEEHRYLMILNRSWVAVQTNHRQVSGGGANWWQTNKPINTLH